MGGNVRLFALRQVRDQILPDSELEYGNNIFMDNWSANNANKVNDQMLPGPNQNDGAPRVNEQVLNSNRNGLDLINQRGQEGSVY